ASRRRTTRSRLYGNRGPAYVRANSAASSRVRTATTGVSRMGGWNKKSVMSPKLLVVDRHSTGGSVPPAIGPHFHITLIPLLYHKYYYYTTKITSISFNCYSTVFCRGRLWCMLLTNWRELLAIVRPSPAGVRITLCPQPAVLRLLPTRETLAPHHARWPHRISLRDGTRRDRADMATGGLHTFGRTRQRRRGCGG